MEPETMRRVAALFYQGVETDPVLRPVYPKNLSCPTRMLGLFLSELGAGAEVYGASRGQPRLRIIHARFGIDKAKRDAWLRHMAAAIDSAGIAEPERTEMREILAAGADYLLQPDSEAVVGGCADSGMAVRLRDWLLVDSVLDAAESGDLALTRDRAERLRPLVESGSGGARMEAIAALALSGCDDLFEQAAGALRRNPELARARRGQTLVHRAAAAWHAGFIRLLFELGAGPNVLDESGHPPLYYTGNRREPGDQNDAAKIVALFSANGADLDLTGGVKRCTPLHMAARRGQTALAVALVRHGANIEARDSNGETPLRRAVNCSKLDTVRALRSLGAETATRCNRGQTPLDASRTEAMREALTVRGPIGR
jgi:hemoglobin